MKKKKRKLIERIKEQHYKLPFMFRDNDKIVDVYKSRSDGIIMVTILYDNDEIRYTYSSLDMITNKLLGSICKYLNEKDKTNTEKENL